MVVIARNNFRVKGKTKAEATRGIKAFCKSVGMKARNIKIQKTTMRAGGVPVWRASFTMYD